MDDRARLTLPDVVGVLFVLAFLAAAYPVYQSMLDGVAGSIARGPELLFGTILPILVTVLLGVIYIEARGGVGR